MTRWNKNLLPLDDAVLDRIAGNCQPRLLMFRPLRSEKIRSRQWNVSSLSPRMQDLAHALLLPLSDRETRRKLYPSLAEQERNARDERTHEPESVVLTAIFDLLHTSDERAALVGEIAAVVNANRKELGEEADFKPRAVGALLKSLGLPTKKLASYGRGLRFTEAVNRRIHQLLKNYGLQPLPCEEIAACPLCVEIWKDKKGDVENKVNPKSRQ